MKKLKDLPIKYDFKEVEKGYFTAGDITKKPYTIVIPCSTSLKSYLIGKSFNLFILNPPLNKKALKTKS